MFILPLLLKVVFAGFIVLEWYFFSVLRIFFQLLSGLNLFWWEVSSIHYHLSLLYYVSFQLATFKILNFSFLSWYSLYLLSLPSFPLNLCYILILDMCLSAIDNILVIYSFASIACLFWLCHSFLFFFFFSCLMVFKFDASYFPGYIIESLDFYFLWTCVEFCSEQAINLLSDKPDSVILHFKLSKT